MNVLLIKVDPYLEQIYPVQFDGSLYELSKLIGARRVTVAAEQPHGDAAWCDNDAVTHSPFAPAFRLRSTDEIIFGNALWHYTDDDGKTLAPIWDLDQLSQEIEFLGFVEPTVTVDYLPLLDPDVDDLTEGEDLLSDDEDV